MLGEDEIKNRFGFHKGTIEGDNATIPRHAELRQIFVQMAKLLDERLPEGRAKAVAFTELQNTSMWSHFAIAEGAPLINESNVLNENVLDELDRNARAYGFEVGRGRVIRPNMKASVDNPFLHQDWRDLNKKPEGEQDVPDVPSTDTDPE